jgi:GNAT superfamily N-acetyltransferase
MSVVRTWRGRYDARDHGVEHPWTSALVLDDGTWLDLPDRSDDERTRLLGHQIVVTGTGDGATLAVTDVSVVDTIATDDPTPPSRPGTRVVTEVVVTWLEMHRDTDRVASPARAGIEVVPTRPSVDEYRGWYRAVGGPWHWYDREHWSDDRLATYLAQDGIDVFVLRDGDVGLGYAEFDRRDYGQCELVYFGLIPSAAGRGLGRWFLSWAIDHAWRERSLTRLWLHTCTLDSSAALPTYRRAGFRAYRHQRLRQLIVPTPL